MNDWRFSKSKQRKVVLMFKPVVDRQKHFAPLLQMLHQSFVGKVSLSQLQDGEDSVPDNEGRSHGGAKACVRQWIVNSG
jgi:hypothetical protein